MKTRTPQPPPSLRRPAAPTAWVAVLLVAAALGVRLALFALRRWPDVSSDEATIGLAAVHISRDGAHPAFFYGQSYMGTIEAYVGAAFFKLLYISPTVLRLAVLGMVAGFLASSYQLAKALHGPRGARLTLVLLVGGSTPILYHQIVAVGGYQEVLLLGSICMLLATRLVVSRTGPPIRGHPEPPSTDRRHLLFAAWGLSAGLGIWSHLLVAPYVVASALLLLALCRWELSPRSPNLWWAVVGLALGLAPLVGPNVAALRDDQPTTLDAILGAAPRPAPGAPSPSPVDGVRATVTDALPHWTGVATACAHTREMVTGGPRADGRRGTCRPIGTTVTALGLALLAAATVRLLRAVRSNPVGGTGGGGARIEADRRACQLAVLGGGWGTLAVYALSRAPAVDPTSTVRYLMGLLVAVPAVSGLFLGPAHGPAHEAAAGPARPAPGLRRAAPIVALALVLCLLAVGTADAFFRLSADVRGVNEEATAIVEVLSSRGIRSIFTDYETCDRTAFLSREKVVCAVLADDLSPGFDRYLPYRLRVESDPTAAYVFYADSPQGHELARRIAPVEGGPGGAVVRVGGYLVVPASLVRASSGATAS